MRLFFVSLLYISIGSLCCAENCKIISINEGLSSSKVFSIAEDVDGLMYFGTNSGLDRYDGTNFTHFNYPEDEHYYPFNTFVYYDKNRNLWLGTRCGLFLFDFNKGRIIVPNSRAEQLRTLNISRISSDTHNRLWLGTDKGVYIYDYGNDILLKVSEIPFQVFSFEFLSDEICLIGTSNGIFQVNVVSLDTGLFPNSSSENSLKQSQCSLLKKDSFNRLWICTDSKGIFIYDIESDKLERLPETVHDLIQSETVIKDIYQTPNNQFLVATDGSGVIVLNEKFEILGHKFHNENDPTSLSSNGIYDIHLDSDNRIWLCTYGGGINIIDPNNPTVGLLKHILNEKNSLANNFARTIIEDTNGKIWVGTKKGISIFFPQSGKWKHIYNSPKKKKLLGNNTILSLCQVNKNEIWAGSFGGGIDRININTLNVEPLFPTTEFKDKIGAPFVYSIYKDSSGKLWIGLLKDDLVRYDMQSKLITRFPLTGIHHIKEIGKNQLFLGANNGLAILDLKNETFKIYKNIRGNSSISNNTINCFHQLDTNNVLIGTSRGLNIFNRQTQSFKHYLKNDGLASNDIRSILKDDQGNFWLGTSNGLSVFNADKEEFTNFENSDGIPVSEYNAGSVCSASNGYIYFGGYNGISFFKVGQLQKISIVPKLFFTEFKIFNKTISPKEKKCALQQHINTTKSINLKANQNSISFSFIGINYSNPRKNRYTWKLEGFDKSWSPATKIPVASYTNLSPGNYILKVKATNLTNWWNSKERTIKIHISPPLWLTYWAFAFYSIVLFGITLFILKFTKIQYQEKHSKEKINFFTQIAHDLRTSLTLIKSPLSRIQENNKLDNDDKEMLNLSQKNLHQLTQRFNQLLDFQKADLNKLQLLVNNQDIIHHINEALSSFTPILKHKKIKLITQFKVDSLELGYDKIKIDKVLLNLFSNAVKYTPTNGIITIKCFTNRRYCCLEVCDNGIGIPKNQHNLIFNQYFRATNAINSTEVGSGVGLMLVKKIIELHNGKISFKSELDKGTCFKIMIPLDLNSQSQSTDKVRITTPYSGEKPTPSTKSTSIVDKTSDDKSTKKIKILFAEDSEELRDLLIQSFKIDYTVYGVSNGKEGLKMIKSFHPDIIVSDVMMPEMDGNTFCSKLKNNIETCHIPVILLTALTDSFYKIESYNVGADDYIEKPFDIGILKSRIENLINSRRMLKDKFLKFIAPDKAGSAMTNSLDQKFLEKAVLYVNENMLNSDFCVNELSKKLNVSRPVLYRKIKALTDQSPQEFIKVIRLQKAAELLKSKENSIGETAFLTGFANPKHFSTSFKQHFGVTPSKFAKQH